MTISDILMEALSIILNDKNSSEYSYHTKMSEQEKKRKDQVNVAG